MKTAFKITGLLLTFLIVLSITVKNKPIFSHIYSIISPMTIESQTAVENFLQRSVTGTKKYSTRIFDNSIPKVKDSVNLKLSTTKKTMETMEKVSDFEKKELDDLIRGQD